jgi:hypothetical protein
MGIFGVPSEASALQATAAQRVAAKAKLAERAASEHPRRPEDAVEFKVSGMEDGTAIRKADEEPNDEQRRRRQRRETPPKRGPSPLSDPEGGLDLTA